MKNSKLLKIEKKVLMVFEDRKAMKNSYSANNYMDTTTTILTTTTRMGAFMRQAVTPTR